MRQKKKKSTSSNNINTTDLHEKKVLHTTSKIPFLAGGGFLGASLGLLAGHKTSNIVQGAHTLLSSHARMAMPGLNVTKNKIVQKLLAPSSNTFGRVAGALGMAGFIGGAYAGARLGNLLHRKTIGRITSTENSSALNVGKTVAKSSKVQRTKKVLQSKPKLSKQAISERISLGMKRSSKVKNRKRR